MCSFHRFGPGVAIALAGLVVTVPLAGQGPSPPRTRYLTSLTNVEVERYLERNDLVFVPIGAVQAHGVLPVDCEYVAAEALALKMAEAADGLVFPYLQFTYPGNGVIGRGTVYVSHAQGLAYLKAIARSLLRQGFRRQIYVTSHAPAAPATVSPLALEFFYETRTPVLYIKGDILLRQVHADFAKVLFGAYAIVGRLNDIPVDLAPDIRDHEINEGLRTLQSLGVSSGAELGNVGFFGFETRQPLTGQAVTAEQRGAWAKEGAAMIDAAVKAADIGTAAQALRDHQRFTREYLIPKYDARLPP